MTLIESITVVVGEQEKYQKVTPAQINELGYAVSNCKVIMSKRGQIQPSLVLHKLTDQDDNRRELDFCYLYSLKSKTGIIIGQKYEHFKPE